MKMYVGNKSFIRRNWSKILLRLTVTNVYLRIVN